MKKVLIVAGCVVLTACAPVDNHYHGTVAGGGESTSAATHINAAPITISGTGEAVKTVDLESGGYTVSYTASTFTLIVSPVKTSGDDGAPIVNAIGQDTSSGVSGTATFHAHGRTTVHVHNTQGTWSLTFTPL
jgi:hypothetical protein